MNILGRRLAAAIGSAGAVLLVLAAVAWGAAPTAMTTDGASSYTEGGAPVVVDSGVTVSDSDGTIASATVRIVHNFQPGDELIFVDQNGISGTYTTGTGVLTMTGTATVAQYQAALRSVEFGTSHDAPLSSRWVTFQVSDGTTQSDAVTKIVGVTPTNDAPTLATSAGFVTHTKGGAAVTVDSGITVSDPDDTNLESAWVRVTGGFQSLVEELIFVDQNGISGSYDSGAGILTLTGTATVAQYQAALRSVQYRTNSEEPRSPKQVEFTAGDGSAWSAAQSREVRVSTVNAIPVVTTTSGSTAYSAGAPAVVIDPGVSVADENHATLKRAEVRIATNFQSGDELSLNLTGMNGSYNPATGVMTLTPTDGTRTKAEWQQALRQVRYSHAGSLVSGSKNVEFTVTDFDDATSAPATKTLSIPVRQPQDKDGDGYKEDVDCDDNEEEVNPAARELPQNGVDDDCKGGDAPFPDEDGDGIAQNDSCPLLSDVTDPRSPRDGCPAAFGRDSDGDGILDAGDPDDDNDGVPDAQDAFPLDPAKRLPDATAGGDTITGTALDDLICGLAGGDTLNGAQGNDTLFGDACNKKAKSVEGAQASDGNDKLSGGEGNDALYGAGGRDSLDGGIGNDKLFGGAGNDSLNGGAGKDALDGGPGNDKLNGGAGKNSYKGGSGDDTITAANGQKEVVDCGAGNKDSARVDRTDKVKGCEKVKRAK